jgi:hypothetical protein
MNIAKQAGVTSLIIASTSWLTTNGCHPIEIAASYGIHCIEQSLESLCSFNLATKSLSDMSSIVDNISTYSTSIYSKGLSSAILPGLLDSFFVCPLLISKLYTFLYAGYSWNRQSSIDLFENSSTSTSPMNINILKDTLRMILFPVQYYTRDTSDAYHNTEVILDLLNSSYENHTILY